MTPDKEARLLKKYEELEKKYEQAQYKEWKHSALAFFFKPVLSCLLSFIFLMVQSDHILFIVMITLGNFIFLTYSYLTWSNQRLLIYPHKVEWESGLFKVYKQTIPYVSLKKVHANEKRTLLERVFNYSDFFLVDTDDKVYRVAHIVSGYKLVEEMRMRVSGYLSELDNEYQVPDRQIINKNGLHRIDSETNEIIPVTQIDT